MDNIKIKVVKWIHPNTGARLVNLQISGVAYTDMLPDDYVNGYPMIAARRGYSACPYIARDAEDEKEWHPETSKLTPEEADRIISLIQRAGARLHEINEKIRREKALYEGTFEIII